MSEPIKEPWNHPECVEPAVEACKAIIDALPKMWRSNVVLDLMDEYDVQHAADPE